MIKCKASVEALSVIIVVESLMATEAIMTGSVNVRAESAIYVINRLLILDAHHGPGFGLELLSLPEIPPH